MISKALSICLVLVLCISTLFTGAAMADDTPSFSLSISNGTPTLGNAIKIIVTGNQLADLYAYEINLTYDSSRLRFDKADYESTGYSITPKVQGNNIQLAHTLIGNKPGQSGQAAVATLTFTAIAEGKADIGLTDLKLVNSKLESVIVSSSGSVSATISKSTPTDENPPTDGPPIIPPPNGSTTPPPTDSTPTYNGDTVTLKSQTKVIEGSSKATSTIDTTIWDEVLKKVKQKDSQLKKIKIVVAEAVNAGAYVQDLPSELFAASGEPFQIKIETPFASVELQSNMFKGSNLPAGMISLYVGRADKAMLDEKLMQQIGDHPVIELHFEWNWQPMEWNNSEVPVTVSIPYTPTSQELRDSDHIVIWYVTGKGNYSAVVNGRYDGSTGSVTFTTTHFSTFAIAFVKKTFDDLTSLSWAKDQIEMLASKGIINGISEHMFKPNAAITRADFVALLVRTLELKSNVTVSRFADVKQGDQQDEALQIAKSLGIAKGGMDNRFRPQDSITREDMMVLVARALQVAKKPLAEANTDPALNGYKDVSDISKYALNEVAALVQSGLVHGSGNGIHPKATTTRAESAVLMYNLYRYFYS